MKNDTYSELIAPVVVLVVICMIVTAALALTYGVSNPIIEKNAKKTADATRTRLLPDADAFTEYKGKLFKENDKVYVEDVYTSNNNTGIVATVKTSSFGGALTMMVGIGKDGSITGVTVTDHSDTPGVGTKNWDDNNNVKVYAGKTSADLKESNIKSSKIEYVSGASVSGNAIYLGVKCALHQYEEMGGVK